MDSSQLLVPLPPEDCAKNGKTAQNLRKNYAKIKNLSSTLYGCGAQVPSAKKRIFLPKNI